MKKIITILTLFLLANSAFSQTGNYELVIEKIKTEKQGKPVIWVMAKLTNHSKETLRYFSTSCSWQEFYTTDNKKLQLQTFDCNKNIPLILTLAPGKSTTVSISFFVNTAIKTSERKFKIGFNLMKATNTQKASDFDFKEVEKKKNLIWSNQISM